MIDDCGIVRFRICYCFRNLHLVFVNRRALRNLEYSNPIGCDVSVKGDDTRHAEYRYRLSHALLFKTHAPCRTVLS